MLLVLCCDSNSRARIWSGGLVFREHVAFEPIGGHPKSGRPWAEEDRIFWLAGTPIFWSAHWDDGDYRVSAADRAVFRSRRRRLAEGHFFTMDLAEAA